MHDRPVLDQVNLVVKDMAASLAFYRLLGVEIPDPPPPWDRHHLSAETPEGIDFDLDSSSFASQWSEGWPAGAGGTVLGFRVVERSTVDEIHDRLTAAGYASQQAPWDAFWGARFAIVEDPEGNAVGIMSEADPARRYDVSPE